MGSASSAEPGSPGTRSLGPAAGAGLAGLALLTSQLGARPFVAFTGLVVALGAFELARLLSRRGLAVHPVLAAAGALAFPLAAYRWGEAGFLPATAAVTLALAVPPLVRGLRPGALGALAATLFAVLYVGFLGAYPVLVRAAERGAQLTIALVAMIGLHHLARAVAARAGGRWASGGPHGLAAFLAGVVGSLVGGLASGLLLRPRFPLAPLLGLALSVGIAASLGSLAGGLVRADLDPAERPGLPSYGGLVARLETVLLAGPAFFYGFRLYLT